MVILLMEEIPHHLGSIKPCKEWDNPRIHWCRISYINSMTPFSNRLVIFWKVQLEVQFNFILNGLSEKTIVLVRFISSTIPGRLVFSWSTWLQGKCDISISVDGFLSRICSKELLLTGEDLPYHPWDWYIWYIYLTRTLKVWSIPGHPKPCE